jgi:hypothetical protein
MFLATPISVTYAGMDEIAAQAGTKGTGAPRTGVGPGTDVGNPAVSTDTGPGVNTITPGAKPKRHVKRRHMRSTVGSK